MIVFQTDYMGDGRFVGVVEADTDPLVEGNWLIPAGCVEIAPPEAEEPSFARWTGDVWEIVTPEPADAEAKEEAQP